MYLCIYCGYDAGDYSSCTAHQASCRLKEHNVTEKKTFKNPPRIIKYGHPHGHSSRDEDVVLFTDMHGDGYVAGEEQVFGSEWDMEVTFTKKKFKSGYFRSGTTNLVKWCEFNPNVSDPLRRWKRVNVTDAE